MSRTGNNVQKISSCHKKEERLTLVAAISSCEQGDHSNHGQPRLFHRENDIRVPQLTRPGTLKIQNTLILVQSDLTAACSSEISRNRRQQFIPVVATKISRCQRVSSCPPQHKKTDCLSSQGCPHQWVGHLPRFLGNEVRGYPREEDIATSRGTFSASSDNPPFLERDKSRG